MFRKLEPNKWDSYVEPNVAMLLKQKGFVGNGDMGCTCGIYCYQNDKWHLSYEDVDNSELLENECLRPTQQAAQKWLRDVHDLHIEVLPWRASENDTQKRWVCKVYKSYGMFGCDKYTNETPKSYEEGLEIALKYSLENLV